MMKLFILDADHHVVEVDVITWAKWWEAGSNRVVACTQITSEVTVSTVFLGLDHGFGRPGPPVLFETMIFGGEQSGHTLRYSSWDDASTGHEALVGRLRARYVAGGAGVPKLGKSVWGLSEIQ